jgi:GNAT superfamily N-acetyltransferase
MRSLDQLQAKRADARFCVAEIKQPDGQFNRDLYFRVGKLWRWVDRRAWSEEQWKQYASAPQLRTFAAYYDQALAGYYELRCASELDGRSEPDGHTGGVEIAYFGLLPEFTGRGLGGALLTSAIEEAWRMSPRPSRVWVHTCNRDHPQALANYQARGMAIYKVEEASS